MYSSSIIDSLYYSIRIPQQRIDRGHHTIPRMSSVKPLREVVQPLGDTFNDPQIRESSYLNFYDDSLIIHSFSPNLPANKEGFKQFIYLLWKAFPDIKIMFEAIIVEGTKVVGRYNLVGTHKR
jgi:hypothetical protein